VKPLVISKGKGQLKRCQLEEMNENTQHHVCDVVSCVSLLTLHTHTHDTDLRGTSARLLYLTVTLPEWSYPVRETFSELTTLRIFYITTLQGNKVTLRTPLGNTDTYVPFTNTIHPHTIQLCVENVIKINTLATVCS